MQHSSLNFNRSMRIICKRCWGFWLPFALIHLEVVILFLWKRSSVQTVVKSSNKLCTNTPTSRPTEQVPNYQQLHNPGENLSGGTTSICTSWLLSKRDVTYRSARPMMQMDPNRFLYPYLVFGPNNQMAELWSSVYVAIRLNR